MSSGQRSSDDPPVVQINVPAVAPLLRGDHVHQCPECYEKVPCAEVCSLEYGLFAEGETPCGSYAVCDGCEAKKRSETAMGTCAHPPNDVHGYETEGDYIRWCSLCGSIQDDGKWVAPKRVGPTATDPEVEAMARGYGMCRELAIGALHAWPAIQAIVASRLGGTAPPLGKDDLLAETQRQLADAVTRNVALSQENERLGRESDPIAKLRRRVEEMRDHHRLCEQEAETRAIDPEASSADARTYRAQARRDRLFATKLDALLDEWPSPSSSNGEKP
jgi:hypothetical protein